MPEIGSTLREARMRSRLDISEIEAETKIRAKYLRALENEEWDLLPGPTYVRTFLRTYAEALGLDAKLLVEEYKLRHDRPSEQELAPIAPPRRTPDRRRQRPPRAIPRAYIVWAAVLALLALLLVISKTGDNGDSGSPGSNTIAAPTTQPSSRGTAAAPGTAKARKKKKAAPTFVRLQLVPTGPVYVCLVAAGDRTLISGQTLSAGTPTKVFRSSQFRLNLGNNQVKLRVNGKTVTLPASSDAIGLKITRKGRSKLPAGARPTCGG